MSDKKPKLVSTEGLVTRNKRKSPAQLIVESLEGDWMTTKQMAERWNVHVETMRRLAKARNEDGTPKVKAPSQAVQVGDMTIYLYSPEDVKEIDEYFKKKGYVIDTE